MAFPLSSLDHTSLKIPPPACQISSRSFRSGDAYREGRTSSHTTQESKYDHLSQSLTAATCCVESEEEHVRGLQDYPSAVELRQWTEVKWSYRKPKNIDRDYQKLVDAALDL